MVTEFVIFMLLRVLQFFPWGVKQLGHEINQYIYSINLNQKDEGT